MGTGGMTSVLVVEDEHVLGAALVDLFELEGYTVQLARDIEAAQNLLASNDYDVVVSDLFREWGGSVEGAARRLREAYGPTPVVLVTGHGEAARQSPDALGLAAVLGKPFDIDSLLTTVRGILAASRRPATAPAPTHTQAAALSPIVRN
jgi:DNA-binding NtrC family response regulator